MGVATVIPLHIVHILEYNFLFVLLILNELFLLWFWEFGEVDCAFPVVEGGDIPLLRLLNDLGLFDDLFDLFVGEQHFDNATPLAVLQLLAADGVEQLLLLPLMLPLDVPHLT